MRFGAIIDIHLSSTPPKNRMDNYPVTILNKLEEVHKLYKERGWKFLIIAGDIFDKKALAWSYHTRLTSILSKMNVYIVIGNHDVFNNRIETYERTPLGSLIEGGTVTLLQGSVLDGFLTGVSYAIPPIIPPAPDTCLPLPRVLVCHAYIGKKRSGFTGKEDDWVLYDDLANAGYEIVIAGHDHREYQMINPKGTNVHIFRIGALSRGTANEHNQDRDPKALEIDVDKNGNWKYKLFTIPSLKPSEVFAATDMAFKDVNRDLKHLMENLELLTSSGLEAGGLEEAIKVLEMPESVYTTLKEYALDFGIVFPER